MFPRHFYLPSSVCSLCIFIHPHLYVSHRHVYPDSAVVPSAPLYNHTCKCSPASVSNVTCKCSSCFPNHPHLSVFLMHFYPPTPVLFMHLHPPSIVNVPRHLYPPSPVSVPPAHLSTLTCVHYAPNLFYTIYLGTVPHVPHVHLQKHRLTHS